MNYGVNNVLEAAVFWWWSYPARVESANVPQDLVTSIREEDNAAN